MRFFSQAAYRLALLTGLTLAAASAHAQTLTLGQNGSTILSGTATLTNTGTTVSGTYTYTNGGTGTPLSSQTSYRDWYAFGPSTANVRGGIISDSLFTYDTSTANVSGGIISGNIYATGTSTANVSGGTIGNLSCYDTSTANVSGGSISFDFFTSDASIANVSGGSFGDLRALNTSTVNVTGGSISSYLLTAGTSVLDLFGTGLSETFVSSGSGSTQYQVTGTLLNGTRLNATYYDDGGTLEFNGAPAPVPEVSSVVSFGLLLLLGLGGVVVSRRRKAAG